MWFAGSVQTVLSKNLSGMKILTSITLLTNEAGALENGPRVR